MYESIPLADFMNEFKNFMSCWKSIVFAGIAIREEQYYNPVALQAWAGSDDREHTAVFNTPELPNGICMFKATRWLTKAWPMIEDIIGQKTLTLDENTVITFADFKFESAAFLTSPEYHDEYPRELNKHIGGWPKLFLQGKFEGRERLVQQFNSKVQQEFSSGKYISPTLKDAANHLIDIRVDTAYQWGLLYLVLTLPIKLKAELKTNMKGEKVLARLELPSQLSRLSMDVRCLVESKLGQKFESIPIKKVTRSGGGQVFSSTLPLHSGERCQEISLHLGGKRVISTSVEKPNLGTMNETQTHTQPSQDTSSRKKVFVVHGRNELARKAMFEFLRAIGLEPIEWLEAIKMTGKGSPYIGEVLDVAFSYAHAILVLLTGDDLVRLGTRFTEEGKKDEQLTQQARPNVVFEAGLAFGRHHDRTVLVQLGDLRDISDLAGRHIVKMDNSVKRRQELASRLNTIGCDVQIQDRTDWHNAGDFDAAIVPSDIENN